MIDSAEFIPEPELEFAERQLHVDIRAGLTEYGPLDRFDRGRVGTISIGMVGTQEMIGRATEWLEKISGGVPSSNEQLINLFPEFPGPGDSSNLDAKFVLSSGTTRVINVREFESVITAQPTKDVVDLVSSELSAIVRDLTSSHRIDLVLVLASDDLVGLIESKYDQSPGNLRPIDFRNVVKAKCLSAGVPLQFIRPRTIGMKSSTAAVDGDRTLQGEATRAWNVFAAIYYKSGGKPWRVPRGVHECKTCYLGISFYHTYDREAVFSSVAQVIDERGHGLIIRGSEAKLEKQDRRPYLDETASAELINSSLVAYKLEHGHLPARVVVHKTSRFRQEELAGIDMATQESGISIVEPYSIRNTDIKLLPPTEYPTLRGTVLPISDSAVIVYTRGFVPYFSTYPGMYVPAPIMIESDALMGNRNFALTELLSLTKLDWNSTQFDRKLPVTIRAAQRVGDVLEHVLPDSPIQSNYGYYM